MWITAEVSRPGAKLAFAESEPKGKMFPCFTGNVFSPLSQIGAPGNFICRQTDAADWVPGSVVEEGLRYLVLRSETEYFKIEQVLFQGIDHAIVAQRIGRL
jgi:hypothetical protein